MHFSDPVFQSNPHLSEELLFTDAVKAVHDFLEARGVTHEQLVALFLAHEFTFRYQDNEEEECEKLIRDTISDYFGDPPDIDQSTLALIEDVLASSIVRRKEKAKTCIADALRTLTLQCHM